MCVPASRDAQDLWNTVIGLTPKVILAYLLYASFISPLETGQVRPPATLRP